MFEHLQDRLDRATDTVEENKEALEDWGRTLGESSRRIVVWKDPDGWEEERCISGEALRLSEER